MQVITTTELRTKSRELVKVLQQGYSVNLIHRSRVIGKVIPDNDKKIRTINSKKLEAKIDELDLPRLTLKEIDRRYRVAMLKKHGQGLS